MKILALSLLLPSALLGQTSQVISKTPPPIAYLYEAKAVSVIDGDTIKFDVSLGFNVWTHNQSVRLLEVYAPETRGGTTLEKQNAAKVKAFVESQMSNAKKIVIQTFKPDSRDLYGRYLAVVWVNDKNLNMEINEFMQKNGIQSGGRGK
jgi:micrococcal nuclease